MDDILSSNKIKGGITMGLENEHRLPLGLCKQAFMKLEAFIVDICEIREDEDLTPDEVYELTQMAEVGGILGARLLNIVKKECGEEEFLSEEVALDEIDMFPEHEDPDILDEEIE
jgi:hypothetical protein